MKRLTTRTSRAERKRQIMDFMSQTYDQYGPFLSRAGYIAKALGMSNSGYLRSLLYELVDSGELQMIVEDGPSKAVPVTMVFGLSGTIEEFM